MLNMSLAAVELPRVRGPHRNRALAVARRARAIELRTQGLTYKEIAAELGYANRGTVFHIVTEALDGRQVQAVDELRSLETARLDALQVAVWGRAMDGDVPAGQAAVRIIMARCKLLGLEGLSTLTTDRPRTVVVPIDD